MRLLAVAVALSAVFLAQGAIAQAVPSTEKGVANIDEQFDEIQRELMCLCGCNTILKSCPHTNCGFAIPARKDIRAMLDSGKSKDEVITFLVEKHGERILAAPKKEGFNLVGYLMPFVAIILVGSLVGKTVSRWARRGHDEATTVSAEPAREVDKDLAERLKKELEDFDD